MDPIVGIDLGTTNSLVGSMEAGFPVLIADGQGERMTPSVVHFSGSGGVLVGREAERMRAVDPASTVYSVKRFMGRRGGEESAGMTYGVLGGIGDWVRVEAGGKSRLPEEVSAEVLKKLKGEAERALGVEVRRAVITVPAYFNDGQRQATRRAGELAGLQVERILNEPTAAALAYGMDKLSDRSRVAVFDLGGGTFDISILELNGGVFEVLSTHGNTRLGGDDVDRAIVEWIRERMLEAGVNDSGPVLEARLREEAVRVKHRLSEEDRAGVSLPFVEGNQSFSVELTRPILERLARPILEPIREHCLRALRDARLGAEDLNEVILVGGMTRMPLVRDLVREVFGKEPNRSQNPDEAVALGAVLQAGVLSGAVKNGLLLDVTPLSLGIETFGGLMNVIIPRNSTIPIKAGEMFTNAVAGQSVVRIHVLQGEREMARDNWSLGRFDLEFEATAKAQARIGVQFEIDADGILQVLARDTRTGVERRVEMSSAVDVSDEAIEKMLEESLEHAFEDVNERVFTEASLKAREMLKAVEVALQRAGNALESAERLEIQQAALAVEEALCGGAPAPLKKAMAALDHQTDRLAAVLIEMAMGKS